MKTLIGLMVAFVIGSQPAADLSGKWNVAVTGHHNISAVLEMRQDGTKVAANFLIPDHGDLEMTGNFVDGKLTLTSDENAVAQLTLTGTLRENGSLSGSVQGQMGEMSWTAARASGN